MKGKLIKTSRKWMVIYKDLLTTYPFSQYTTKELPVYQETFDPESFKPIIHLIENKEVEFEIIREWELPANKDNMDMISYAKLILPKNESNNKEILDSQKALAESLWESCDGCNETDKHFWINGFIQGLNYKQ